MSILLQRPPDLSWDRSHHDAPRRLSPPDLRLVLHIPVIPPPVVFTHHDHPVPQPLEPGKAGKLRRLVRNQVDHIELADTIAGMPLESRQQLAHHRPAKRVVQEDHTRQLRQRHLRRVPRRDRHRTPRPSCPHPSLQIALPHPRQVRIELHPAHLAKSHRGGQHHHPPLPAPHIEERVLALRSRARDRPPLRHCVLQSGGRRSQIRHIEDVMCVPRPKLRPIDPSARIDPVLPVERVHRIRDRLRCRVHPRRAPCRERKCSSHAAQPDRPSKLSHRARHGIHRHHLHPPPV